MRLLLAPLVQHALEGLVWEAEGAVQLGAPLVEEEAERLQAPSLLAVFEVVELALELRNTGLRR